MIGPDTSEWFATVWKRIERFSKTNILSRLFKSSPPRNQWGRISLDIAKGLEEVRNAWFGLCIEMLQSASKENPPGDHKLEIRIRRNKLYGNGLLALKAYQLYIVSGFLVNYIRQYEGKDFADILYAQVCGLDLENCLDYWGRYHEMEKDGGTQLFRFTNDIAKHITGDPSPPNESPPLIEAMIIGEIFPLLYLSVCMVVADAFGDSKTVAKLKKSLSEKK
jgi:hypothetical protein